MMAILLLGFTATPAFAEPAFEENYAVYVPIPAVDACVEIGDGKACFKKYGDTIIVLDKVDDSRAVWAQWSNWLWDGDEWQLYRHGYCMTNVNMSGNWGTCNKDFYEDSTYHALGNRGSGLRLAICDRFSGCSADIWIRNNA